MEKSYFAQIAYKYDDQQPLFVPEYEQMLALITELVALTDRDRPRVLDIGCGTGVLLCHISRKLPKADLVGFDKTPQMIDIAKQKPELINAQLFVGEMQSLDNLSIEGQFDCIVSTFAIHHLSNLQKRTLFNNVFNLLTVGGAFWIADNVKFSSRVIRNWVQGEYDRQIQSLVQNKQLMQNDVDEKILLKRIAKDSGTEIDYRESLEIQLEMLKNCGFEDVDSIFRWGGRVIFGGYKNKSG